MQEENTFFSLAPRTDLSVQKPGNRLVVSWIKLVNDSRVKSEKVTIAVKNDKIPRSP